MLFSLPRAPESRARLVPIVAERYTVSSLPETVGSSCIRPEGLFCVTFDNLCQM